METFTTQANNFQEFNQFQTYFYTNVDQFNMYSNFEIKRNAVQLLVNICKGYPLLSLDILNIYSNEIKGVTSPAIIKALQRAKFINGFSRPKVPQFIYYKNMKAVKVPKPKKPRISKKDKIIEFESDIVDKIQTILFLDNKDYQDFKGTERVQKLGINLTANIK